MINIEDYAPKPVHYKEIFKKHNIPTGTVANYLGLTYPYTCNMLNGIYSITPAVKKKLKALSDQLEAGDKVAEC